MAIDYDYTVNYPDEAVMTITGEVLNSMSDRTRARDKTIARLRDKIKDLKDDDMHDELIELRLRDKNPSLKDAWDQYQVVLKLTQGHHRS